MLLPIFSLAAPDPRAAMNKHAPIWIDYKHEEIIPVLLATCHIVGKFICHKFTILSKIVDNRCRCLHAIILCIESSLLSALRKQVQSYKI